MANTEEMPLLLNAALAEGVVAEVQVSLFQLFQVIQPGI